MAAFTPEDRGDFHCPAAFDSFILKAVMGGPQEAAMARSPTNVATRYDVTLVSAGPKPRRVARIIAEFTLRERAEALEMIETAPVLILQGAGYASADGVGAVGRHGRGASL